MKIDNGQANFDPAVRAAQSGDVRHARGAKHTPAGSVTKDTVNVSPAAQFASRAISASQSSPDIRPDVVARAKQLLADGKIGSDPHRLADKLIDHALEAGDND